MVLFMKTLTPKTSEQCGWGLIRFDRQCRLLGNISKQHDCHQIMNVDEFLNTDWCAEERDITLFSNELCPLKTSEKCS